LPKSCILADGSFSVIGGQVAVYDGKGHNGVLYYFLSPDQVFDRRCVPRASARKNLA
jgi:hypothetical protein